MPVYIIDIIFLSLKNYILDTDKKKEYPYISKQIKIQPNNKTTNNGTGDRIYEHKSIELIL